MRLRRSLLCLVVTAFGFAQNQKQGAASRLVMPENVERVADLVYAKYGDRELRLGRE